MTFFLKNILWSQQCVQIGRCECSFQTCLLSVSFTNRCYIENFFRRYKKLFAANLIMQIWQWNALKYLTSVAHSNPTNKVIYSAGVYWNHLNIIHVFSKPLLLLIPMRERDPDSAFKLTTSIKLLFMQETKEWILVGKLNESGLHAS